MRTKAEKAADPLRTGRPPIPKAERRSEKITIRFTREESAQVRARAANAGKEVAEFIRELVLKD